MRWVVAKVALLAGLAGLLLQLTVRDRYELAAPVFYALPLPLAGVAFLVAAWLARGRIWRRCLCMLALLVLGGWFFRSYGWAYPAEGKWKAIVWNIGHPRHPFQPLIALVRAERPDVVALVESGGIAPVAVAAYEHALPGYRMVAESKELSCLVRGEILASSVSGLINGSDVAKFRVKLGPEQMNVFVCDLGASPVMPRRPQIQMLAERTFGQARTIVMGDFNTPLESVHLDWMRAHFDEVMDGPHRGFRETWFYELSLLSLDQIWLSRDLESRFATRRMTFASDHEPVVVTFSARP